MASGASFHTLVVPAPDPEDYWGRPCKEPCLSGWPSHDALVKVLCPKYQLSLATIDPLVVSPVVLASSKL